MKFLYIVKIALAFSTLFAFNSCSQPQELTPVDVHGQLKVSGNKILDHDNNPVQLKGMSFFWSQYMGDFYNANVVKTMRSDWGCTVIRAALGVNGTENGYLVNPEEEYQKVITLIDAAIAEGLYIIVDWHDHHAHLHTDEAKDFFAKIASKYGDYPNIIYEPYNEPLRDTSWEEEIKPYHLAIIDTIRAHDPDNIIVCGTRSWSQDVDEAAIDPIKGENIAYTLHYYAATHKESLREKAEFALENGIALMVTEFGLTKANGDDTVDLAESEIWWEFLDQHQISWCNWSIADKDEKSASLRPGADKFGDWQEKDLTTSGKAVRSAIRKENPFVK